MANKTGRKSLKEEIKVVQYMAELAPATFKVIRDNLASTEEKNRKWAAEMMVKLYGKSIPQEIVGDVERPIPIISLPNAIPGNDGNQEAEEPNEAN